MNANTKNIKSIPDTLAGQWLAFAPYSTARNKTKYTSTLLHHDQYNIHSTDSKATNQS